MKIFTDKDVTIVNDGEWVDILKSPNVKKVSMVAGKYTNDADYEIIYNDFSTKLFKFG